MTVTLCFPLTINHKDNQLFIKRNRVYLGVNSNGIMTLTDRKSQGRQHLWGENDADSMGTIFHFRLKR